MINNTLVVDGSTWRSLAIPSRTVRVLRVYPTVLRYAYLKNGQLTATTYTAGIGLFLRKFRPCNGRGSR